MPAPYDYTIKTANPLMAGLQGYEMAQQQRARAMALEQQQAQMAEEERKRQRQQQYQQDIIKLTENPFSSADDYVKLQAMYPESMEAIKQVQQGRSKAQLQGDVEQVQKIGAAFAAGKNDIAINQIVNYRNALENSGRENEVQSIDNILEMAKENPGAVSAELNKFLLAQMGPEKFTDYFNQIAGGAGRTVKSEILDDGSTIQVMNNRDVIVKDPEGNIVTGKEAAKTIMKAREFGVQLARDITYSREEGKWKGQEDIRAGVEEEVTRKKEMAKGEEKRAQTLIERGSLAAEGMAGLKRGIELLDQVKTGGPRAVALRVKQLFGIETADEGELSNQLSKAVLGQLRETFGAAFTEREGARLERIEASFTKSPEANRRLLEQALAIAERNAKRAIKAAEERGDMETVEDIKSLLEFSLSPEAKQGREGPPQLEKTQSIEVQPGEKVIRNPQTGERAVKRNGKWININTGIAIQ